MRIALDAMGGDHGLAPNVQGAVSALNTTPDLEITLVGDKAQIEAALSAVGGSLSDRLDIFHSAEVVGMKDKPAEAMRKKPDNSIAKSWYLLATKKVDGLVSAGNTGAVVAAGLFLKRFLKSVRRPGIAASMPTAKGKTIIMDVGANVFPKPGHLLQYGVMGAAYAKYMAGIEKPTIGLMNVGEEEGKGHDLVQKTYELFRNSPLKEQFIGNVEGRDVHRGVVDVIVTDGFVGNVLLKHAEGAFEFMMGIIKREIIGILQADQALAANALKQIVGKLHHSSAGGAPLLGIDGVCIICHGSSDDRSISNALSLAAQNVRVGLNDKIVAELATLPDLGEE
jgi:phosphate acyltransferase